MSKKILIAWWCWLLLPGHACAHELAIINLKHRSADELLPVIRPLLNQDEMISGMNYQLLLRASPRNTEQIRLMLEGIDIVPRSLKITVLQNVDSDTVARLTEVSGRIGRHVRLGGGDNLNARIVSTRTLEDEQKSQQIRVLEGNRALVRSGQSVPVQQTVQTAWGTQVTTRYQDVESGFYVLPRVQGERVTLEIAAKNDTLTPNQNSSAYPATRIHNASTTLSGRL
ncbi:MAG: hypothetical protein A2342_07260, partial [Gallionellales bacterium RIFOXYB12_FULL_54_9]